MNVAFDFTKIIMTFGPPSQQEKGEKFTLFDEAKSISTRNYRSQFSPKIST